MDFSEGIMPSVIEPLTNISRRLFEADPNHPDLHCILIADEMSIDGRVEYDASQCSVSGTVSAPFLTPALADQTVTASKILVYMLKSISSHQKQAVAWFFTGSRLTGQMMENS